jgi:hypothetical protein
MLTDEDVLSQLRLLSEHGCNLHEGSYNQHQMKHVPNVCIYAWKRQNSSYTRFQRKLDQRVGVEPTKHEMPARMREGRQGQEIKRRCIGIKHHEQDVVHEFFRKENLSRLFAKTGTRGKVYARDGDRASTPEL